MKTMVMSSTYRQSSQVTPAKLAKDPENRLLSRGPRYRLDAEMLRDQALAVGGLLVDKVGGPSVKPPQPAGLWEAVGYTGSNTVRFTPDSGEKIYRRSLYTFWKRTSPPPQMSIADAPSREECRVRRERTNTPMQALMLMNEPQYFEAARRLGELAMKQGGETPEAKAKWMLHSVLGRQPEADELADMLGLYHDSLSAFRSEPEAAKQAIAIGESKADASLDPAELAAWAMVGNLVMNLDEVINKN
jgi:hypothetical protein